LFSNSPLSIFGHLLWWNQLIWVDSNPMAPLELALFWVP
jgi:hypothetical protein